MMNDDNFINRLRDNKEVPDKVKFRVEKVLENLPENQAVIRKKSRWAAVAAASVVCICSLSLVAYAGTKFYNYIISENKEADTIKVEIQNEEKKYIPPIKITPNYLPEGYKECDVGRYSLNGEYGTNGITITDAGYYKNFSLTEVSYSEIIQLKDATALYTYTEGTEYCYDVVLFYEETGRVIRVFGYNGLSEEEILKVCENITYTEVPELDPEHKYEAFSWDENEHTQSISDEDIFNIPGKNIINIGEEARLYSGNMENPGSVIVENIEVGDTVDMSMLSEDTVYNYDDMMQYIENGHLKPYERTVEEWIDKAYHKRKIAKVNVKNVKVTLKAENKSGHDCEVSMLPVWKVMKKTETGSLREDISIPGYEGENGILFYNYPPVLGKAPYYFDASSFKQTTHFYYMNLKAGESKKFEMWFAIPEDQLQDSYLVFNEFLWTDAQAVKISQ